MLNSRTMTFPALNTLNLFSSPFSTGSFPLMGSSRHMFQNNKQAISEVKKIEKSNMRIKRENTGVLKCNNMYEQVGWFKKQNLFQSILKIIVIFFISLTLFAIDLFGYQMWLGTTFAATLLVIHQSRIFQRRIVRIWVFFGLVFSAFVIVNHLFITFLNFISSNKAELLYYNYLTLLPSLLITTTLFSLYFTQPLTLPSTLCPTPRFPSCFKQYFHNLKNHLISIKKSRYYLLQIYSLSFLSLYILVSLIKSEKISTNARSYLCLFHPFVFVAQLVTFAAVVFIRHFFFFWVQETVFWAVSGWMYDSCNHYTGIPLVLELLGVVSTEEINSEAEKSGLTANFNIFSLADSRRSNGLTRTQHQNIYRHSLAWLLNFLSWRSPTLNNKLDQYCSAATRVSQPKTWTSYWQILLQFMNQELQRCVDKTYQYSKQVQEVGILFQKAEKSQKPLGWIDYAVYLGIAELRQWILSRKATYVARYFNIFELIIEVVNMNGFDQLSVDGEVEDIRKKLEQLQMIVNRICDNVSVSEIMEDRLKLVSCKCMHILNKMPK